MARRTTLGSQVQLSLLETPQILLASPVAWLPKWQATQSRKQECAWAGEMDKEEDGAEAQVHPRYMLGPAGTGANKWFEANENMSGRET